MAAAPHAIGEGDFESRVMRATVPVLVVFTADWCAPCRWLTPYLDELSTKVGDRALIFLLDVDRFPELTRHYRVASVPTVILIREGREVDRSLGVEPDRLRRWVAPPQPVEDERDGT